MVAAVKAKEAAAKGNADVPHHEHHGPGTAGSSTDPGVKTETASPQKDVATTQYENADPKPPLPLTKLTSEQRERNIVAARERDTLHRQLLEKEGRPTPPPDTAPMDIDDEKLPDFESPVAADVAQTHSERTGDTFQTAVDNMPNNESEAGLPARKPCVLTPGPQAGPARHNSHPQFEKLANRTSKAKRAQRRAANDPLYSISLSTETEDETGRPFPLWWAQTPPGQRKRERGPHEPLEPRATTTLPQRGRGRSPPPGLSWKDMTLPKGKPVHKKSRVSSTASRSTAPGAAASSSSAKPADQQLAQQGSK